jgi:hypothetical protein
MVVALMLFKLLNMTGQDRHRKPCGLRLSDPLVLGNCRPPQTLLQPTLWLSKQSIIMHVAKKEERIFTSGANSSVTTVIVNL